MAGPAAGLWSWPGINPNETSWPGCHPGGHPDPFRSVRDLGRAAAAVHVSSENWKVVHPGGSQRGSRPYTTPGTVTPWALMIRNRF